MGAIADRVRQMRGCSLAQIVAQIEQMEGGALFELTPAPMNHAEEFETEFWPRYPHKTGKPVALRAFIKARKATGLHDIISGLGRYVASKPADRPWLNPSTFLNQCRFNDEPAPAAAPALKGVSADRARLRQEIADGYERSSQANRNSGNDRRLALGSGDHIEGVGRRLL